MRSGGRVFVAAACGKPRALVNARLPRTLDDSFIHLSQIAYAVRLDEEPYTMERRFLTPEQRAIGRYVATLVEDGATVQTGIGAIPDAVLAALHDKHDLGVHTEMFSDGVMELATAGVITGAKKTIHRGKIVAGFLMGSRALYDWVDDNPMVELQISADSNREGSSLHPLCSASASHSWTDGKRVRSRSRSQS